MVYRGSFRGGVVVLEPGADLPEGAQVRVELERPSEAEVACPVTDLFSMADLAVETGIPDLATNVDHYLYGHPKVADAP